jgi:hypothetical protein
MPSKRNESIDVRLPDILKTLLYQFATGPTKAVEAALPAFEPGL